MIIHCLYDRLECPTALKQHPKNRNIHSPAQIDRLAKILAYQDWRYPIKISKLSGYITSGHGRLHAALQSKWKEVPVVYQDYESDEQEYADLQSDNAIAAWAELDLAGINYDLADLGPDFDLDMLGIKDFILEPAELNGEQSEHGSLSDRFLIPPFSVFNAREGWWQERKRMWIAMGIQSELGRGGGKK